MSQAGFCAPRRWDDRMQPPPDFTPLGRALQSLQAAQVQPPRNELERDGVIQRFEYTFELCWKSIRRALLFLGRADVSGSPRPLFRDALEEHLIPTIEPWFTYLEARNATAHLYNSDQAEQVFAAIQGFAAHAEALLQALRQRCQA
jgi:nucleotidyltransferase substrate binding protein (TIGR01987 family)